MNAGGPSFAAVNRRASDNLEDALLALARREPQGRQLVEQLLSLLDRATGSGGAALYLESDGGYRRELATAGSVHEEVLPAAPGDGPGQLASLLPCFELIEAVERRHDNPAHEP